MTILRDVGHQMPNNEKVLLKGLKGIREEVEWYMAQLDQSYMHFGLQEKRDFYKAVLITLDAAIDYAKRYADLAREMATKEANPSARRNSNALPRSVRRCLQILPKLVGSGAVGLDDTRPCQL